MRIVLSYQSAVPVYEQIKEQIKASVLSGALSENDSLPPIRQLARDLKVSVITITRAYKDLELEGIVQSAPEKGFYIMKVDCKLLRSRLLAQTKESLRAAIRFGKMAGLSSRKMHSLMDAVEKSTT